MSDLYAWMSLLSAGPVDEPRRWPLLSAGMALTHSDLVPLISVGCEVSVPKGRYDGWESRSDPAIVRATKDRRSKEAVLILPAEEVEQAFVSMLEARCPPDRPVLVAIDAMRLIAYLSDRMPRLWRMFEGVLDLSSLNIWRTLNRKPPEFVFRSTYSALTDIDDTIGWVKSQIRVGDEAGLAPAL